MSGFQDDTAGRCKRDALPTELTAPSAEMRGYSAPAGTVKGDENGTQRQQAEQVGRCSPGIVPDHPAAIHIRLSDDDQHIRKWSREPFEGGVEYARVDRDWRCVVDGEVDLTCVIDTNEHHNCLYANEGMVRTDCKYWQRVKVPLAPTPESHP